MNVLISYPKSGRTWIETRSMIYLYYKKDISVGIGDLSRYLERSHLGYDAIGMVVSEGVSQSLNFLDKYSHIYVLLRDAKDVLNSIYYNVMLQKKRQEFPTSPGFPEDRSEFIKSGFGVKRFVHYLNQLNEIEKKRKNVNYLSFNDLFLKDSVSTIPELLTFDDALDEADINLIWQRSSKNGFNDLSSFPQNIRRLIDTSIERGHIFLEKHYKITEDDSAYIEGYIHEHSNFKNYNLCSPQNGGFE